MTAPPSILIDGVPVSSGPAPLAAIGPVEVGWGSPSILDEPRPAKVSAQFLFASAVDAYALQRGFRFDMQQPIAGAGMATVFSGRIASMSAHHDSRGRLRVTVHATDHMREFRQSYVATAWERETAAGEPARIDRLRTAMASLGWTLLGAEKLPPMPVESSMTMYDSITLATLLRRWLAWWGPQATFWDASRVTSAGKHERRIEVGWAGRATPGDVLATDPAGVWSVDRYPPEAMTLTTVPARAVLRDVGWESTGESRFTGARISYQTSRRDDLDDGTQAWQTSVEKAVQTTLDAAKLDRYGLTMLELETSAIAPRDEYRAMGRRWIDATTSEWRMSDVTIPRASAVATPDQLVMMLDTRQRRRTWWVVDGVDVVTPSGGISTLRGTATGGTLRYDPVGGEWSVSMSLTDTRTAAPTDQTWEWLAQQPDARFSTADAPMAGAVSFADFTTITTTR